MTRHYSKRRDANEAAIVRALEQHGASVERLNGDGVPDLLVGYCGTTFLLEVKNPATNRRSTRDGSVRIKGGMLTPEQVKWREVWRGGGVLDVASVDEALAAIGAIGAVP